MKGPACTVEELAKAIAVEIVLHVPIIGAVKDVKHAEPHLGMLLLDRQSDLSQDLQVR